ncbi:MAG: hypothetical protein Q9196_002114 [Gyalolechia fulgens]
MLYLHLWWLLLPLSVLAQPLSGVEHEDTAVSERLGPRDGAAISELDDRSTADLTERVVHPALTDLRMGILRDRDYVNLLLAEFEPQPPVNEAVLLQSTQPGPLQHSALGTYGAYKDLGEKIEFDFEYPPFTKKKIIIVRGSMDSDTTDTEAYVEVLGYPIGDFKGNVDEGMRIDVNIFGVARGYIELSDVQSPTLDSLYLTVDLRLPLRRHLHERWLLLRWGHQGLPAQ